MNDSSCDDEDMLYIFYYMSLADREEDKCDRLIFSLAETFYSIRRSRIFQLDQVSFSTGFIFCPFLKKYVKPCVLYHILMFQDELCGFSQPVSKMNYLEIAISSFFVFQVA